MLFILFIYILYKIHKIYSYEGPPLLELYLASSGVQLHVNFCNNQPVGEACNDFYFHFYCQASLYSHVPFSESQDSQETLGFVYQAVYKCIYL